MQCYPPFTALTCIILLSLNCVAGLPIIGILTQSDQYHVELSSVKFLESSGARVVPVKHDLPDAELATLMLQLNGLFVPNGNHNISGIAMLIPSDDVIVTVDLHSNFMLTVRKITQMASDAFLQGDYFPILVGSLLGLQTPVDASQAVGKGMNAMLQAIALDREYDWSGYAKVANTSKSIGFTAAALSSRIYGGLADSLYNEAKKSMFG